MSMTDDRYNNVPADDYEVIRVGSDARQTPQAAPQNADPYGDYEVVRVGGSASGNAQVHPVQRGEAEYDHVETVGRPSAQQAAQARAAQASRRPRPANGQQRRSTQPHPANRPQQRRAAAPQGRSSQKRAAGQGAGQGAPAGFVPAAPARKQYSRGSGGYVARKQGLSTGAKVGIAILIIAILLGLIGGFYYVMKRSEAEQNLAGNRTEEELAAIDAELTGTKTYDEPFNILLLGSDERLDDPSMGARTDTIILVRVDPINNIVSMISLQRDTFVQLEGVGDAKLNAAFYYNGLPGTIAAVKDLTGAEVDHYAEINFDGLVEMVDAVGGVDVYVDELIDDPDAGDVVIEPGEQHLDGAAALTFARSRAYADGDYTRSSNQRKVIMGLAHKLLESPATELVGLIRNSSKYLVTDMSLDDIMSLATQMRHNEAPITIYSNHLPSYPTMIGDVAYVVVDEPAAAEMMRAFNAGENIGGAEEEEEEEAEETGEEASEGYVDETYSEDGGGGEYSGETE